MCRVAWTRHFVTGIRSLPAAKAQQVLSGVPRENLEKLERASAMGWLPFGVHMSVLRCCRDVMGATGYRRFCGEQVSAALRNPVLFAGTARACLGVFGRSPLVLFKVMPTSCAFIFRDAGQVRVQTFPNQLRVIVTYENFPLEFSQDDTWSLIWLGTCDALSAFSVEGRSEFVAVSSTAQDSKLGFFEWTVTAAERAKAS